MRIEGPDTQWTTLQPDTAGPSSPGSATVKDELADLIARVADMNRGAAQTGGTSVERAPRSIGERFFGWMDKRLGRQGTATMFVDGRPAPTRSTAADMAKRFSETVASILPSGRTAGKEPPSPEFDAFRKDAFRIVQGEVLSRSAEIIQGRVGAARPDRTVDIDDILRRGFERFSGGPLTGETRKDFKAFARREVEASFGIAEPAAAPDREALNAVIGEVKAASAEHAPPAAEAILGYKLSPELARVLRQQISPVAVAKRAERLMGQSMTAGERGVGKRIDELSPTDRSLLIATAVRDEVEDWADRLSDPRDR